MMPERRLKHGVRTSTIIDHTALRATWPPENSLNPARQLRTDSDHRVFTLPMDTKMGAGQKPELTTLELVAVKEGRSN